MRPPRKSPSDAETSKGAVDWPVAGFAESNRADATGCVNLVQPGIGERGAGCARAAGAPAPAALPCLNRNNSAEAIPPGSPKYRFKTHLKGGYKLDQEGRVWNSQGEGVHHLLSGEFLTSPERKRAFILRRHVEAFVDFWGRNHSLFFTTTDADGLSPREYARRWNSLLRHQSTWISGFVRVLEPQKNGRPHFHNLTAVDFDTKPDAFDWEAFSAAADAYRAKDWSTFRAMRERYKQSAVPELRALWEWGRRMMPRYGLGRCEILPIRKQGAIAEYIGKYLDKGMTYRVDRWKGVRRFDTDRRTSEQWKRCGRLFSWASPGATQWRKRCREIALAIGLQDTGDPKDLSRKLGPRWAFRLRGTITTGTDEEFREVCESLAASFNPRPSLITITNET